MKEIKSDVKIKVIHLIEGSIDSWGIKVEHVGNRGGESFVPYSTQKDAENAVAFARTAIREGYSLHAYRKVIALERAR